MTALIIILFLASLCLYLGFKLRSFDDDIEDVFRDAFNQKNDE